MMTPAVCNSEWECFWIVISTWWPSMTCPINAEASHGAMALACHQHLHHRWCRHHRRQRWPRCRSLGQWGMVRWELTGEDDQEWFIYVISSTICFKRNFWCKRGNYLIFELGSFSSELWWSWWWWWWWGGGGDDGYFEIACTLHAMRLLQLIQVCSCRNSLPVHKQGHKKGGLPQRTMLIF